VWSYGSRLRRAPQTADHALFFQVNRQRRRPAAWIGVAKPDSVADALFGLNATLIFLLIIIIIIILSDVSEQIRFD